MRENKFRAWDKEYEVMVYSDKHNHKDYDCEYFFDITNSHVTCVWIEDYDDSCGFTQVRRGELDNIMQYTGFKDENNKEIYEGDILKFPDVAGEGVDIYDTENIATVVFKDGRFELENFKNEETGVHDLMMTSHQDFIMSFDESEVIGNIYENENLLNQKEM